MRFRRLALVVVPLAAAAALSQGAPAAVAAGGTFNPADIISNGVFFDASSMSPADVQSFLNAKGAACKPGTDNDHTPCLKDYRMDTLTRVGDERCPLGYTGGQQESTAQIIAKVASSCGVSPKVLLVTLQKEQGLVTTAGGAALSQSTYSKAMGYGCPDSGGCDPKYYGLANQLYLAAWQFRGYVIDASRFNYRAGVARFLAYNPNSACGGTTVTPANSATAALYNYTPYQPNAAALAAGYDKAGNRDGIYTSDTGDGDCASYGNRNFWLYFTDWFGSTHFDVSAPILPYWQANASALGDPTTSTTCGLKDGGCWQGFQRGYVHWSPATGAHITRDAILGEWVAQGSENGPLGYPTMNESGGLKDGGAWQAFQGGFVHWSPATGAHAIRGGILNAWVAQGSENGSLGYPLADEVDGLKNGGAYQVFQGGYVLWSGMTGAHITRNPILGEWQAQGSDSSPLGYPTMDESGGLKNGGVWQAFQGGYVHWSPASGAHATRGGILSAWVAQGSENGPLGYPLMDEVGGLKNGGVWQAFQGGYIHWSPASGAYATRGGILGEWASQGSENGLLGYPTMNESGGLKDGGAWQAFQGGYIHWSPATGAHATRGGILNAWVAQGSENGPLGYPLMDEVGGLKDGGAWQAFQGGYIHWSGATGAHVTRGAILSTWAAQGSENGRLGYPTSDMTTVNGVQSQRFQGGSVSVDKHGRVTVSYGA